MHMMTMTNGYIRLHSISNSYIVRIVYFFWKYLISLCVMQLIIKYSLADKIVFLDYHKIIQRTSVLRERGEKDLEC